MKKLKKRLLAVALAALAAATMAMPSFAENVTTSSKRHIALIGRSMYLNLEGSGYAYRNRDVTVYSHSTDDDQNWKIYSLKNGLKVYTAKASTDGTRYALNINRSNGNCNIYDDIATNNKDSVVTTPGTSSSFSVILADGSGQELTVDSNSREATWGGVTPSSWKLAN